MNDFDPLALWLAKIADNLDDSNRTSAMQKIATRLKQKHGRRIAANIQPDGSMMPPRKQRGAYRGRTPKRGKMFKTVSRQLKTAYSATHAEVGYGGRLAKMMTVHQHGQTIRPSPNARPTRYAVRELVGFGADDEVLIIDEITRLFNE